MSQPDKNVISFYQRNAQRFDEVRTKTLFEKTWLDRFLSLIPENGTILDLGCGSGEPIATYIIAKGYAVTGVDSSPEMIAICEERFPGHTWLIDDIRTLALEQKFNGILAWNSFFHLNHKDQKQAISVFKEHARQTAPLMFTASHEHNEIANPLWDEPLYHASFSTDEYRELLGAAGFKMIENKTADPECNGHTVYLAQASE